MIKDAIYFDFESLLVGGRFVKRIGQIAFQREALVHFLVRRMAQQHSLSPPVVSVIEAGQQDLEVGMASDVYSQDIACDTTVEALHHTVGQRWLGLSAQPRGLVKWIAGRLIMPLREAAG